MTIDGLADTRRDVRPLLPPPKAAPLLDPSCGSGELARLLQADGVDAKSIDVSPEHAAVNRAADVAQVRRADLHAILAAHPACYVAVAATDSA